MIDTLWQDVRYAARSLTRRPLLAGAAVVSLALGIGINTAIFSAFERVLLRPLAVPASDQIVNLASPGPRPGSTSVSGAGPRDATFSYPLFRDLEHVPGVFTSVAAHRDMPVNLSFGGETVRGRAELVTGRYFSTLALPPAAGRLITDADTRIGAPRTVVLSHRYWAQRFSRNPAAVNETLRINGETATIVGVATEGFDGTTPQWLADVFVPASQDAAARYENRRDHWLYVFARLRPDVSREQAEARLKPPFAALIRDVEFPIQQAELHGREPNAFLARTLVLEDGSRGSLSGRENVQIAMALAFLVSGLVLLIACGNVANLLLGRMIGRSAEVAVRLSLGASPGRLLRLLLAEACLLSLAGSALAILVARVTLNATLAMLPADVPFRFEFNGTVLLFSLAIGLGTGLLFGLFPALHALRSSGTVQLSRDGARLSGSRAASRFRASLATGQIALATALLAQTGLFIVSLVNVTREDVGVDSRGLITFEINPALNGYVHARSMALFEQLEDRLAATPGVMSVSAATIPMLGGSFARNTVTVEGFAAGADDDVAVNYTHVGEEYFKTLGIPVVNGREFTRSDNDASPKVAVVNESFTRRFGLGANAVGKRMALGRNRPLAIEIVGVVRDTKYNDIRQRAVAQFFLPYRQVEAGSLTFYVRSALDSALMAKAIVSTMKSLDPNLPVETLRTMEAQVDTRIAPTRVLTSLASAFALLAIVLAGIGLYAVLAQSVAQRVREIGIRVALGAHSGDISSMVVRQVGRMTVIGIVFGLGAAIAIGRLARTLLFGVESANPALLVAAAVGIVCVAAAAAAIPTWRAVRVDPVVALRAE